MAQTFFDWVRPFPGFLVSPILQASLSKLYVENKIPNGEALGAALGRYVHQTGLRKKSSETGFFYLQDPLFQTEFPLGPMIDATTPFPICFMFGSTDWMEFKAAKAISAKLPLVQYYTIEGGHDMTTANPIEVVARLLEFVSTDLSRI